MSTFGEVSYDDFSSDKKSTNSKDLFLRLTDGSNEIRLLTAPYQYLVHKYKKDPNNPKDFGQKVGCSKLHGSCQLCDTGDKAKARWFFGVIERKTGTYKILDVSYAVFQGIRKLAQNVNRWGDPTKYDIDIIVDKNGGATGYYTVQPLGKEPLSAADQVIKDTMVDLEDLKRRCTPPTPEMVQKRLDKINGVEGVPGAPGAPGKAQVLVQQKAAPVSLEEDDDDSFPAFDAG